ncbi:diguanylate cyclase [Solibacillus sp. FSL R7-0668]|uniref:sensor domain-containing diguanylate cyclase n=1 Tax=Solibacillus sp. FSL R7-0668 TaxID=2921688 RepID=UPI0030F6C535
MSTEIVMHYVLVYILPSIYLYILGTYILVRSYSYKRAKLVAASIFCSAIGYTADFIRVLLPIEFSHFLQLYIVLFAVNLSFALTIHVIYDIVKTIKPFKMPLIPYILYGFPVLILGVGFLESQAIIFAIVYIAMLAVTLFLLYTGYKYTKIKEYRFFFKACLSFIAIAFTGLAFWKLDWSHLTDVLPATPGLFLTALSSTLISYLLVKTNIIPSTVKRYSALLESSATPIVILDKNKRVLEVNEIGKQVYQMKLHTDFRNYFNYTNEPAVLDQLFTLLDAESYIKGYRITYLDENGIENIVLMDASKVKMVEETYYYCMIHEVTLEFQRRSLNEHLAYHDVLTGIYNRTYFEEEVKRKLAQDVKKDSALIICDLNFFKAINDTYGHQTGDNVLVFTANCFRENLPRPHILARLGGDEFVMFFEEFESKEQFLQQINEVRHTFQVNLYKQDDIEIEIVPSLGIAFVEEDGVDYEQLYHTCDVRMYEDKKIIKEQYLQRQV